MPGTLLLLSLAAPSAYAETTGLLQVRSSVPNAEVYIDNQLVGPAPLDRPLPVGTHQVRVVADNFTPYVRRVELTGDKPFVLDAKLQPGDGSMEWVSAPAGARLFIDGTLRGPLPIRLSDLPPGPFSWRVEAPLYEDLEGREEFTKGKNKLIVAKMTSSRGLFVVETNPAGARVMMDGKEVGQTPLRLEDVPPGVHTVLLQADGYAGVIRSVDTSDGRRGEVKASLPDDGSTLRVLTRDDAAKVFVNGLEIGTGSSVELGPLEPGRTSVSVVTSEGAVDRLVDLPESGRLTLQLDKDALVTRPPLTQRWAFWAAVGGVAVAGGATTAAIVIASQPPEPPSGDTVVTLP